MKGLSIKIKEQGWTSAHEISEDRWGFASGLEFGAGCHTFEIQSEDRAGNLEPQHDFNGEVVWHPRERPDLSGSRLSVDSGQVLPGDLVDIVIVVPNSGWQYVLFPPLVF